jgi:hypothetical protein
MKIRVYAKDNRSAVGTMLHVRDTGDFVGLVLSDDSDPEREDVFAQDEISYVEIDKTATFASTRGEHKTVEERIGG